MSTSTNLLSRLSVLLLLAALAVPAAQAQRTVTLRLNTATLPDTLAAEDTIQVRGCLQGCEGDQSDLPGGEVIAWDDRTSLLPDNQDGDYWRTSFQIPDEDTLAFKFFSPLAQRHDIDGWESGANHMINGGSGDTTLTLHYFEKGADQPYGWRPWEQKQDSVTVWFRVYMNTESALTKGYDGSQEVGVRGSGDNGAAFGEGATPLGWSDAGTAPLTKEADDQNQPGYHLYSGAVRLPESAAGSEQPYKFFLKGFGDGGYEGGDNRTFTIPDQDTTLHWKYFDRSSPASGEQPVSHDVGFSVDMSTAQQISFFDPNRDDTLIVRGGFNGWGNCLEGTDPNPSACTLPENSLTGNYENIFTLEQFPEDRVPYKYWLDIDDPDGPADDSNYENPLDYGSSDRSFVFDGDSDQQNLGNSYFNNIRPGNVIPEDASIDVTFRVNMDLAMTFESKTQFDPAEDQAVAIIQDPLWRYTQQLAGSDTISLDDNLVALNDGDGDGVYTGTITVEGPTYNGIAFQTGFVAPDGTETFEGPGGFDAGRWRYQYVLPGDDGSFPSSYELPLVGTVIENDPLPFACNPTADVSTLPQSIQDLCYEAGTQPPTSTGVERIGGETPTGVTLQANYPNPFNGQTTFAYTLQKAQPVTLTVYDVMGREVATLVDRVQRPSSYRVTFDADNLASGVYLYQLRTPTRTVSKTMTVAR